jgi:hypothetical protein
VAIEDEMTDESAELASRRLLSGVDACRTKAIA